MDADIIAQLQDNLKEIGAELDYLPAPNGKGYDGEVWLRIHGRELHFRAELKKEPRTIHMAALLNQLQQYKAQMLIAERLFPKVKEEIRNAGINYMEANGNMYIEQGDILIHIDGRPPILNKKAVGNRAFTKTGLKVLFALLQDKELINAPHRVIAEHCGVGLGNIPMVIQGLKTTGHLIRLDKTHYKWQDRQALLERWVNEYIAKLRPQLTKGRYAMDTTNWREQLEPNNEILWGGEPGADLLVNDLRPQQFTLYTTLDRMRLMKEYRLRPDPNGELEVFEKFWVANYGPLYGAAPPLLIYADLLETQDGRNQNIARQIYERFIEPNL